MRWIVVITCLLAASVPAGGHSPHPAPPPATQPQSAPAEGDAAAWSSLDGRVRDQITNLLQSSDWPLRVFSLLRLERYAGEEIPALVRTRLSDPAWQVRCFALRQAVRMKVAISAAALETETDPRVIRTALRAGVHFDQDRISKLATRLLRSKNIDDLLLGIEIAAATDTGPLRTDAATRLVTMLRNMNDAVALLVSPRLAAVLHVIPAPENAATWANWHRKQPEPLMLPPKAARINTIAPMPLVAQLDDEVFSRLLDYLSALTRNDLDLVIVMDCTASMVPMVNQARAGVDSLILFLNDLSREMRLAFIGYRDRNNPPVCDGLAFTTDIKSVREFLFKLRITGGRDYPEAVLQGFEACRELNWNKKASRQIVLVGDAPPHPEDIYRVRALLESMRDAGVVVHAVHVPMQFPAGHVENMSQEESEQATTWLETYNSTTREIFADIASTGGGKSTVLAAGDDLVLSIMHFTIEEAWWSVFDEFYDEYVRICR